jgi:hypothetical protein
MYPLDMTNPVISGFAVANSADEHRALSEIGYGPQYEGEPEESQDDKPSEPVKRGPGRPKKVG